MSRHYIVALGTVLALAASGTARAQSLTPPIEGTVAPDQTVQQEYAGAHVAIVKTMAGFGHVGHFTKSLFVHHPGTTGDGTARSVQRGQATAVHGQTR